jgi:hypothetical protein
MAANGAQQGFEPVLAAHNMMQSAGNRAQKEQAHQFLEQFQKSVCVVGRRNVDWANRTPQQEAWTTTLAILESAPADAAAKLFAATTLKGKVGLWSHRRASPLTPPDCIRSPPSTPPAAPRAPSIHNAEPRDIPCRP